MKRVFLTFSIIVALASFVSVTAKMGNSLPDEVKILSTQEVNSETKSEHKSKIQEETADLNKALKIIQQLIFGSSPEQSINQKKVFDKLRKSVSETEFSSEELMILIEDAMEIDKKYQLIFDFVIRGEYARRATNEGINADEALQFASSEYIQLPKFILKKKIDKDELDDVLSDLGCGVVWKDRAKYSFVLSKYFGKGTEKNDEKWYSSRRVQNYLKLIAEIDKFFEKSYSHLVYLIAQDFYYADIPQEKIQKIFSFSDDELKSLIKPKNYEEI